MRLSSNSSHFCQRWPVREVYVKRNNSRMLCLQFLMGINVHEIYSHLFSTWGYYQKRDTTFYNVNAFKIRTTLNGKICPCGSEFFYKKTPHSKITNCFHSVLIPTDMGSKNIFDRGYLCLIHSLFKLLAIIAITTNAIHYSSFIQKNAFLLINYWWYSIYMAKAVRIIWVTNSANTEQRSQYRQNSANTDGTRPIRLGW